MGLCLLASGARSASPESSSSLQLGGSLKTIAAWQRLRQTQVYPFDQSAFAEERLRLQGTFSVDALFVEVAHETSLFLQSANDPHLSLPGGPPSAAWKAKWQPVDTRTIDLYHRLDRAYAQLTLSPFEVSVGKQVIPVGVGLLFSAVSQVPRYPFVMVDPEYQRTEDAVAVIWKADAVTLEARALPKTEDQQTHGFHVRAKAATGGLDWAVTTGRTDDKTYVGLETSGSVGDAVVRGELVAYDARGRWEWQGLAGFDRAITAKLTAQFEIFYNGFGKAGAYLLESTGHRPTPYRGRWYGGAGATYELSPRLKLLGLAIANVTDPSALLQLQVTYSLAANLDLLVGQFVSVGGAGAEFGGTLAVPPTAARVGLPDLSYAEVRWAF